MSEPISQPASVQAPDIEERAQAPAVDGEEAQPVGGGSEAAEPVETVEQAETVGQAETGAAVETVERPEPVEAVAKVEPVAPEVVPVEGSAAAEDDEAMQIAAPDASSLPPEPDVETPEQADTADPAPTADSPDVPVPASTEAAAAPDVPVPAADEAGADAGATPDVPVPTPAPAPKPPVPSPAALARHAPVPAPSPAYVAGRLHPAVPGVRSSEFGRVAEDGTVFVKTPEGEKEVGSYPGATPEEALAYFTRKYTEVDAQADLLLQRVTQTELSSKEAADGLAKLRESTKDLRAVGDLVALAAKVENVATALEARRQVESAERAQAREAAKTRRQAIVEAAEKIAGQPEARIQWKASSTQMRQLLDDWKAAQKDGPKLDRETEQSLWHRLSSARNGFDKLRRVHFAQLGNAQSAAKAAKEELVEEAERLAQSTEWGSTAGAFKRLMDRWRQAGRASRGDDDALWTRFKAAQDSFFAAKDQVVAAENEEYSENLKVKEDLLKQAQALLPIKDLEAAKAGLRQIQDKWDAAGKVPRADMDRIEKSMRRVEAAVRDAEDRKWHRSNPEVAARAQSLVTQLEAACEGLRADLAKAEASGDAKKIGKAKEALEAREAWLAQARSGLAEFTS